MFHEPAGASGSDPSSPYKARIGTWMFLLYALIYAGFVVINVGKPELMEKIVFWGLNLAVVYGFFLIVFAMVLALIYNALCGAKEREMEGHDAQERGK